MLCSYEAAIIEAIYREKSIKPFRKAWLDVLCFFKGKCCRIGEETVAQLCEILFFGRELERIELQAPFEGKGNIFIYGAVKALLVYS